MIHKCKIWVSSCRRLHIAHCSYIKTNLTMPKTSSTETNGTAAKKQKTESAPMNKTATDYASLTFEETKTSASGKTSTLKISSWNVDGVRAWLKKGGLEFLNQEQPDILTLQETKCSKAKMPQEIKDTGYDVTWVDSDKEGYAGIALLSKKKPLSVVTGLGKPVHDKDGRLITAEYDNFYLVTSYVPNAGRGLPNLPYRQNQWDPDLRNHLLALDKKKPVILCGDLNVAHKEIDLKNPKTNKKTAGFTQEERDGFTELLESGFVDSYRHLYPDTEQKYTFWSFMGNSRAKNTGWRLDYFVLSSRLMDKLCDNVMRSEVYGSDHCPITLYMADL